MDAWRSRAAVTAGQGQSVWLAKSSWTQVEMTPMLWPSMLLPGLTRHAMAAGKKLALMYLPSPSPRSAPSMALNHMTKIMAHMGR